VRSGMSVDKREALTYLRDRIEVGQLRVVIDQQYPLEQIVEAHRYVDTGRKRGNVVVTVGR
jgi:NADPH:quinone reductase-like Zn-dependent oxidoreductase